MLKNWPVPSERNNRSSERLTLKQGVSYVAAAFGFVALASQGSSYATELERPVEDAKEFLIELDYTDIHHTDTNHVITGCGRGDGVSYDFTADTPGGAQDTEVRVCAGIVTGLSLKQL